MKGKRKTAALVVLTAALLAGCNGVSQERQAAREKGITLLDAGDHEGAVREFEAALADTDKVSEFEIDVLKYRAQAEYLLEDHTAALHTYSILKQIDGERAEYSYLSAICAAENGDTEEALLELEAGRALDEKHHSGETKSSGYREAVLALGNAFRKAGAVEKAQETYKELLNSPYESTEIYNCLALLSMEQGQYEAALEYIGRGRKLSDEVSAKELAFNEAVCMEYMGRFHEALSLFEGYAEQYGSDERVEHEIAFLNSR